MVEQIQPTPPYEVLSTFGATTPDSKTASTQNSTHTAVPSASKAGDTITLSAAAQANQLYLQGNSVSQIAALLGLPPATVDNDLNISPDSSIQSVQPTTAQSPASQISAPDGATQAIAAASPYTAPAVATSAATSVS